MNIIKRHFNVVKSVAMELKIAYEFAVKLIQPDFTAIIPTNYKSLKADYYIDYVL